MEKENEISVQRRRRAEKLNSSDPEGDAWQLAFQCRKNEQKKGKRVAGTPEQREERLANVFLAKRRRQEAERRARQMRHWPEHLSSSNKTSSKTSRLPDRLTIRRNLAKAPVRLGPSKRTS